MLNCTECDEPIRKVLLSAERFTKTESTYHDDTRTVGERVRVKEGWACDCTEFSPHGWSGESVHDIQPDRFPDQWLDLPES